MPEGKNRKKVDNAEKLIYNMSLGGDGGEININRGRATDSKRHLVITSLPEFRVLLLSHVVAWCDGSQQITKPSPRLGLRRGGATRDGAGRAREWLGPSLV